MSIYNALYGRDGHGVGPNEPEKKGFARFCQMVGRDLGQLLGTNLMVCVLCLPAALGVSLGVTLLSLPLTVVCSVCSLYTHTPKKAVSFIYFYIKLTAFISYFLLHNSFNRFPRYLAFSFAFSFSFTGCVSVSFANTEPIHSASI